MNILAIETSCDETAAAIVADGVHEVSSTVASSKDFHEITGGIVPEVAARKQLEFLIPVINDCLNKVSYASKDIDAIAVTIGPGLIGSLLVGVEGAKALSLAWNKPLIPVNHLIGHIYANFVDSSKKVTFPAMVLLVSGGHTDLVLMRSHTDIEYIGGTLDDAAGEAFDKTARLLGISKYLGGVALSKLASTCTTNSLKGRLPRPMIDQDNYDFSFSGLKTAVKYLNQKETFPVETVAREFEDAVCDVLVAKTIKASRYYGVRSLLLGGGVSANATLRKRFEIACEEINIDLHVPSIRLCTDNAVYIASAAYFHNNPVRLSDIHAIPSLTIMD